MTNHKKMKQLPAEMRPYEKFRKLGAKKLSDEELLAIILRSGTKGSSSLALASEILTCSATYPGLLGLHHLSLTQLQEIKGIGEVKAIQIKCIGELSRRIAKSASKSALRFQEPGTIADYYMEDMRHLEQETLVCMMLDTRNHLLGETELSRGTVNASLISPREIYLEAMSYHAVYIILVHNHPSGDPLPSEEDIRITRRVCQAGEILGISLLDHIIIGDLTYCSLRQEGMMQLT